MLKVTSQQMALFEKIQDARLVAEAQAYLRMHHSAWAQGQSAKELEESVFRIRAFAHAHELYADASLLQLLEQAAGAGWPDPMPTLAHHLLTRRGFGEDKRIADWRSALMTPLRFVELAEATQ